MINAAMPGLVKVGFSTKDPALRAKELAGTGNPHRYDVAYDVLAYEPREIEQRVHKRMALMREGKEWFKCSIEEAIAAIRLELCDAKIIEAIHIGDEDSIDDHRSRLIQDEQKAIQRAAAAIEDLRIKKFRESLVYYLRSRMDIRKQMLKGVLAGRRGAGEYSVGPHLDWDLDLISNRTSYQPSEALAGKLRVAIEQLDSYCNLLAERINAEFAVFCSNFYCDALFRLQTTTPRNIECPRCNAKLTAPPTDAVSSAWVHEVYSQGSRRRLIFLPSFLESHQGYLDSDQGLY